MPHLRIWAPLLPGAMLWLGGTGWLATRVSPWFVLLTLIGLWLFRGFVFGLVEVMAHPQRHMDVLIEERGLGFLVGEERWWVFLDGILWLRKLHPGVWTVHHHNGTVIHLLASAIPEEQLAHLLAHARAHTGGIESTL